MKQKRAKARQANQLLRVVHTPVFKQRIVADKTRYQRNRKHRGSDGFPQQMLNLPCVA